MLQLYEAENISIPLKFPHWKKEEKITTKNCEYNFQLHNYK